MAEDNAVATRSPTEDELSSCSDSELLNRFCDSGDEAGFRAIVERHAGMVSSVCLSVLRNQADAEDAFQATFFVLARKARSVRERKSLAAWLHRVALRAALAARRKRMSQPSTELPAEDVLPEKELRQISSRAVVSTLHEELDRLPEKYRTTLIACYLKGASRKTAAEQLGISEAAVKTRLERARRMLRRRMGVLGFAAFAVTGICQSAIAGGACAMSGKTISTTVSIALQVKAAWSKTLAIAAGNQASLALAQGVLKTMLIATALKTSASALIGLLAGLFAMSAITLAEDPPNPAVVQKDKATEQVLVLRAAKDAESGQQNDAKIATDDQQRTTVVFRLRNVAANDVANAMNSFLEKTAELRGNTGKGQQNEIVIVPEAITNSLIVSSTAANQQLIKSIVTMVDQRLEADRGVTSVTDQVVDLIQDRATLDVTPQLLLSQDLAIEPSQSMPGHQLKAMIQGGANELRWQVVPTLQPQLDVTWQRVLPPVQTTIETVQNLRRLNLANQTLRNVQLTWATPKSAEELEAENDQLRARVEELEQTLKLHERISSLEEENARLKERLKKADKEDK